VGPGGKKGATPNGFLAQSGKITGPKRKKKIQPDPEYESGACPPFGGTAGRAVVARVLVKTSPNNPFNKKVF